jgi:hypothetical protein
MRGSGEERDFSGVRVASPAFGLAHASRLLLVRPKPALWLVVVGVFIGDGRQDPGGRPGVTWRRRVCVWASWRWSARAYSGNAADPTNQIRRQTLEDISLALKELRPSRAPPVERLPDFPSLTSREH